MADVRLDVAMRQWELGYEGLEIRDLGFEKESRKWRIGDERMRLPQGT